MCEKPNEAIIRKIQNMLNLAKNKAASEEEAANAMMMVQDLLAKYNLEMAVVEETAVAGGTVEVKENRQDVRINHSAAYKWQQKLCRTIAEANFCWYWVFEGYEDEPVTHAGHTWYRKVKRHMVLGKESNCIAVTMMFKYLAEIIEELIPYKANLKLSKSAVSWREGCASRLEERISEHAYKMQHPTSTDAKIKETGLVLQSLVKKEYISNYNARYEAARAAQLKKELTEAEKAKAQKASDKWWEKYRREQQRAIDKRDLVAFMAGRKV